MKRVIKIIFIIVLCGFFQLVKSQEGYLVNFPLKEMNAEREFSTIKGFFLDDYSKDPLLNFYFGEESPWWPDKEEEIQSGCLQMKIEKIYYWDKDLLYYLTCDCARKYASRYAEPPANRDFLTPFIMVYEGKNKKLQRLNWCPFWGEGDISGKDKAIKAYHSFLKKYGVNLRTWPKEKIAALFILTVCHCLPYLPQSIYLLRDYPGLKSNQIALLEKYSDYERKYIFTFKGNNKIKEVICFH